MGKRKVKNESKHRSIPRLYILNYLKVNDKEFRKLYLKIIPENLSNFENENIPLEIDADKISC
jgi:hypothetical protein